MKNLIEASIKLVGWVWNVFHVLFMDNVHFVIAIEINESKFRMFRIAWKAIP